MEEVTKWEKISKKLKWVDTSQRQTCIDSTPTCSPTALRLIPSSSTPLIIKTVTEGHKEVLKKLQGRSRSNMRRLMSSHSKRIEHYRSIGKLKRVIPRIIASEKSSFSFDSLFLPGDVVIADPTEVHNKVARHFDEWFTGPQEAREGIHSSGQDWREIMHNQEVFYAHCAEQNIPKEYIDILWSAMQTPATHPSFETASEEIAETLRQGVSLEEFKHHLKKMDHGTAPGWTGCTHAMMKGWPDEVVEEVHALLSDLGPHRTPHWWSYRLVSPLQKVVGSNSLDSLRPIMLLEVMRKVWTTLLHRKIANIWERYNLLAEGQSGGRPGRSTESPIIQLIAYLDQNRRNQRATFVTFWDMTKAFDSPSKNMLRSALMRLAVPAEWCEWFIGMDMAGGVIPKSPIAQELLAAGLPPWEFPDIHEDKDGASRFTTRRGCSQGDPPSPSHWDAFFDILMRALELGCQEPCVLLGKNRLPHHMGDAAFIDDLTTASPTYLTLQRKIEIVCAFALAFCLKINLPKLKVIRTSGYLSLIHI